MTRIQFLTELSGRIDELPQPEKERVLTYYSEILLDRMEEGMSDEEAVASIEPVPAIAEQILKESAERGEWNPESGYGPAGPHWNSEYAGNDTDGGQTYWEGKDYRNKDYVSEHYGPRGSGGMIYDGGRGEDAAGGKKRKLWLMILLSPFLFIFWAVYFSLLASAYITAGALIFSLGAVAVSLGIVVPVGVLGLIFGISMNVPSKVLLCGMILVCAGLFIFSGWGAKEGIRGLVRFCRWMTKKTGQLFRGRLGINE